MSKALVIKELRETVWIVILAAGAFAFSILRLVGYHPLLGSSDRVLSIPFVDGKFLSDFEEIAAAFAIVLALRQSAWESLRGTSVFLLWRPISRDRILAVKMAVGLALLLGTTGLAFLTYALWAARPGTHASPFYWSMTIDSAVMWLAMTPIYLGSFLSGIRPGRLFGSRAFPLIAAIIPFGIASIELPPLFRIACLLAVDALGLAAIHYVVRSRDYP